MTKVSAKIRTYPLLPVRDIVVFPYMLVPLAVGRRRSLNAIQRALEGDHKIIIAGRRGWKEKGIVKRIKPGKKNGNFFCGKK